LQVVQDNLHDCVAQWMGYVEGQNVQVRVEEVYTYDELPSELQRDGKFGVVIRLRDGGIFWMTIEGEL